MLLKSDHHYGKLGKHLEKVLPSATLGIAHSAPILTVNNSLLIVFLSSIRQRLYRVLNWLSAKKSKGDGQVMVMDAFAECHDGKVSRPVLEE